MKRSLCFYYVLILVSGLYAFGPPGMTKPGVYRSNAAGLPLEKIREVEQLPGGDPIEPGNEEGSWVLVITRNDRTMEERLYHNQKPVSSRIHRYQDNERVISEYDQGTLVEEISYNEDGIASLTLQDGETREYSFLTDEESPIPMPGGDQKEQFRYSTTGRLITITGENQQMLFTDDIWGIKKNLNSEGSFFLTKGDEEIFRFWKGEELLRTETSTIQANNRWRQETVSDEMGEIVRVYDRQNRLRTVRTRGNRGYSLYQCYYPSPTMVEISYRARGIDEESRVWKSLDGELERLLVERDGEMVAEIERLDDIFLHTIYDGVEKMYQEKIKEKELKGLGKSYPSLSIEGVLW